MIKTVKFKNVIYNELNENLNKKFKEYKIQGSKSFSNESRPNNKS